jgi:poly(3-hydroxybutyrate) depolymerase
VTRYSYNDSTGVTQVESVLVEGLAHAFPIQPEAVPPCGQPSDYVVSAGVCAAQEISRFWGLSDGN